MKEWCRSLQIKFEATVGYFPEANGIAERYNQTIPENANAIRFEVGLQGPYCELTCICAMYFKNRSPSRIRDTISWK